MYLINNGAPHSFEKQNLVTLKDRNGFYDLMVCSKCGTKGKCRKLTVIEVPAKYSSKKVYDCDGVVGEKPKKIRITNCHAFVAKFKNLTPGSEHDVIKPPDPYVDDNKGVWVMGVGEPVKVINSEFENL